MNTRLIWCLFLALLCFGPGLLAQEPVAGEDPLIPEISHLFQTPGEYVGKMVSVNGSFEGWRDWDGPPPVSRSDWTLKGQDGKTIYCSGSLPGYYRPDDPSCLGRMANVMGRVELDKRGKPYLTVFSALPVTIKPETMVSVSQILFDPLGMKGRKVGLMGVLTKGYDSKGLRMYFLADPTGAITLEKLPRLYPKGTILRVRGIIGTDSNGLPQISQVDIVSANP